MECKKPGANLDNLIGSNQLSKYGNLSDNALITDYRRFILLHKDNEPREVDLSVSSATNRQDLQTIVTDFVSIEARKIDDPQILVNILAERCRELRRALEKELLDKSQKNPTARALITLLNAF